MPIDYAALAAQHGGTSTPPQTNIDYASLANKFQTPQSAPKVSFGQKVGGFFKGVGNALTSSEQTLGKGLSTVFDKNSQRTVEQIGQQENQGQQALIQAIHAQTDPVKKNGLIQFLKAHYGVDYQAPTATDLNPAFGLSNKQVIGAAVGTALDIASAGSYGNAVKGAESGKLLKTSVKTIEEIAAEKAAQKALPLTQKALNVSKTIVKGAAQGYAYDVAGNLQADNANFKPGFGTIIGGSIPLAVETIKGLGFIAKEVAKQTASTLSGVPKTAIEEAFKNPETVQSAIRVAAQDGEGAAQKILTNATDALDNLKTARQASYEQNLAKLEKEATYTKGGQLYVKRALTPAEAASYKGYVPGTKVGVPTHLSTQGVKQIFTNTLKDFGATGGGKSIDLTNAALDNTHLNKLTQLQDRIYSWSDTTPTGLNRLTQVVDSYRLGGINLGSSEKKFNAIVSAVKSGLSDYVGKRVPQIAEMRARYAAESQVIDSITHQLKANSADPNTMLRKLLNVFNPKSESYRPIVRQLGDQGAKNLMSDIAGLTMSKWTPEGLAKYLDGAGAFSAITHPATLPAVLPAMAATSPRIVGETTTALGKAAQSKTAQIAGRIAKPLIKFGKKIITRQAGLSK